MVIEKIFSDAAGQEKVYSVVLSEEEYVLFSKTKKEKLSLADQDYINEQEAKKNASKVMAPLGGALAGGALGTIAGGTIKKNKAAAIGGVVGAAAGAYGMHKVNKKITVPAYDKHIKAYKNASKEDREYYRHKNEKIKDRQAIMAAGVYAGR